MPDLAKINALVGYTPEVTLDQLLHETVEHVKAQRTPAPQAAAAHAR